MKIKILVSLFIFLLLFSSAWFLQLQQQNHQEFNDYKVESPIKNLNMVPMDNENTQLNPPLNTEISNVEWKLEEPFKPREYVRIQEY